MAWNKPKAREIKCGMEINMYGPGEDDDRDAGRELI
ncbi:coenzyme PQQ synthesis protein PqqA (plasmid) [Sulfitobacter sp. THAF37]|nr:pyrroloquinoline quinone precursor peptide PqqA [Sulfitobacter sp. THAF37]QFT60829.1 coenzyme PQQ synthesis protein PqqA [Sulfitobacter sp. THAF37]